jgi:hypothetical protein
MSIYECDPISRALPDQMDCWICGKPKGQPPERCPGHYDLPTELATLREKATDLATLLTIEEKAAKWDASQEQYYEIDHRVPGGYSLKKAERAEALKTARPL